MEKPKKPIIKRWWFWVVAVSLALFVIGLIDSIATTDNNTASSSEVISILQTPSAISTDSNTPVPTGIPKPSSTPKPTAAKTPVPTKTPKPTATPKPTPDKEPETVGDLSRNQWQGKFVGSSGSNKYHSPSCTHAKKILLVNAVWWDKTEEAKKAGYEPCKSCSPHD